jgi:hypothetical protein
MTGQSEDDICLGSGKPLHANISQILDKAKVLQILPPLGYPFCPWDGNVSQYWIFRPMHLL